MEASTFDNIKNIYGLACIVIAFAFIIPVVRQDKQLTINRMLGIGILGWSGYIALSQSVSEYNPLDDWIITVPLIYLSLITINPDTRIAFSLFNLKFSYRNLYILMGIIATISIAIARDGNFDFDSMNTLDGDAIVWFSLFIIAGLMVIFGVLSDRDFEYPQLVSIIILLYPLLYFFGNATVSDPRVYYGSSLDELGIDFYWYSTILVGLSVFCKILFSIYHVREEGVKKSYF
tara:strand:+ start:1280 stop:1978 length:699 start_codon:yes stop_codon:yes gene_type:complete